MTILQRALDRIGHPRFVLWGTDPDDASEIDLDYLDAELPNGKKRLTVEGVNNSVIDLNALRAEFTSIKNQDAIEVTDIEYVKSHPQIKALLTRRPSDIETWIDNNVTNLAEAKSVIKLMAVAMSLLAKTIYR